jgi:hypothetical protein
LPDHEEALEAERRRALGRSGDVYIRRAANDVGEVAEIWMRDVILENQRGEVFVIHSGAIRARLTESSDY